MVNKLIMRKTEIREEFRGLTHFTEVSLFSHRFYTGLILKLKCQSQSIPSVQSIFFILENLQRLFNLLVAHSLWQVNHIYNFFYICVEDACVSDRIEEWQNIRKTAESPTPANMNKSLYDHNVYQKQEYKASFTFLSTLYIS